MREYQELVRKVLWEGHRKENRTGVDTISVFGAHYTVDLRRGFPLLTTKEMSWKNIVVEFCWFLTGGTNVGYLHGHGVKFWDAWADERGEVPVGYGEMWRAFPDVERVPGWADEVATSTDQLAWVMGELQRNPLSRRLVLSHWSPRLCHAAKLPPCPVTLVFNVQEGYGGKPQDRLLNLHVTQRSADVALGVPYDLASYSLLLEVAARVSGIRAGTLSHLLVDAHAYTKKPDGSMAEHDHAPGLAAQLMREPHPLPALEIAPGLKTLEDFERLARAGSTEDLLAAFRLEGYDPHPAVKFKVAV